MKTIIFALSLLMMFTSCALKTNNAQDDVLLQLSVQSAVAQMLHDHPDWKGTTRDIMGTTISAIDARTVLDLSSVSAYVKAKVNMQRLLPVQQALVNVIIDTIVQNTQAYLTKNELYQNDPSKQLVYVRQVCTWVYDIARI